MTPETSEKVKRALVVAGVACAVGVAGFSAGRFSAPEKVETRDVEKVVYRDRVVEKVVEVKARAEVKVVYKDRVVTKEGTVTERIVERTETKTDEKKNTDKAETVAVDSTKTVERIVTLRPDWRVGVLAGGSLTTPSVQIAGPLVLGVQVDRRIIGGLSVGLWANTVGAAGVGVSFEF